MIENYFKQLYDVDVNNKKKSKNGLNYLSWAVCWAEVKKMYPDATFKIYEQSIKITEIIEGKIREGALQYQSVYKEPKDLESKGYVVNLTKKKNEDSPISTEQYNEWMKEAIGKGMIVRPDEYERALGLPFRDVW